MRKLLITIDVDDAGTERSIQDLLESIRSSDLTDYELKNAEECATGPITDRNGRVIGNWYFPEEVPPYPNSRGFRLVAKQRYAREGAIEVPPFAAISPSREGAVVQAWLYVPLEDAVSAEQQTQSAKPPSKGPRSVNAALHGDEKIA